MGKRAIKCIQKIMYRLIKPHVVSLIMHWASCNNQVITTSASSIALYISATHSPILGGPHSVYKHAHIVVHDVIDFLEYRS